LYGSLGLTISQSSGVANHRFSRLRIAVGVVQSSILKPAHFEIDVGDAEWEK